MQKESRPFFPNGIRALVVDSDARFLKSATLMLSLLNFRVATCESPSSAVKLLSGKLKDADVVLVDAFRAKTCGFDFRGTVEPGLSIPVIYFISPDHGADVDELIRIVRAATYVIKKPLDADELCSLWRVIKWHQFFLQIDANFWVDGNRVLPATIEALLACSTVEEGQGEEDDDGRARFRVVRSRKGRKRKAYYNPDGCSGGSSVAAGVGGQATKRLEQQMNVTEGQDQRGGNVAASHQRQSAQRGFKEAAKKNNGGSEFHGSQAMDVQGRPVQNQQHGSLFMQPVPQMLNVPANNPMISTDAAGPSSSNVAAFAGAPAVLPVHQVPARAKSRVAPQVVYSAPAPELPPVHQQPAAFYDFGNIAPPAALPTMASTSSHKPRFTLNHHQQQDISPSSLLFGRPPFPYHQGPLPAIVQQVTFASWRQDNWMGMGLCRETGGSTMLPSQQPPATDLFTCMAGGGTTFGGSPAGATDAGACDGNAAMAHLQSLNLGAHPDENHDMLAAMMDIFTGVSDRLVVPPQHVGVATNEAAALYNDSYDGGSLGAPQHVGDGSIAAQEDYVNYSAEAVMVASQPVGHGMAATAIANEVAAMQAGLNMDSCSNYSAGSFMPANVDGSSSASFMVPQDLQVPTGNQQMELGAPEDIYTGSLVGSSQGPSAVFNENADMAAMFPSDQYEENTVFPLHVLLGLDDDPMYPEGQQVGATDSATTTYAAGTLLDGQGSGTLGPNRNVGADDDGLDILNELLMDDNAVDFLLPRDMNNGHH